MISKRKQLQKILIFIGLLIIILAAVYFISPPSTNENSQGSSFFPKELSDLKLVNAYSGEKAKAEIKNMHGGEWDFEEGHVGHYETSEGKSATIWVSIFQNRTQAQNTTQIMTIEINKGDTPFSITEEINTNTNGVENVYYTYGMGQDHYYWQKENMVIWIALTNMNRDEQSQLLDSAINVLG